MALDSAIGSDMRLLYAITNSRVIKSGFPVIRADSLHKEISPIEKGSKDWVHHPEGEDVAACLLGLASDYPQVSYYRVEHFLNRELLGQLGIGIGLDVFLMGRHITMRDVQCPSPVARFGKLAMMDRQFIRQPDGQSRECFLVTAFEPGEHSGAPVFITADHLLGQEMLSGKGRMAVSWLLGIDQGHLQDYKPVINAQGDRHPRGWKVPSPHGLIVVTPAWKLRELLWMEQLRDARRKLELRARGAKRGDARDTEGGLVFTRADYVGVLRFASRRIGTNIQAAEERSAVYLLRRPAKGELEYSLEDFERDFPNDDSCLNWLKDYLYPNGIHCRKCQDTTSHLRVVKRRSYSCSRCGHHVHPTVGTGWLPALVVLLQRNWSRN
jgi:hypothetical protein